MSASLVRTLVFAFLATLATHAGATFHLWQIDEIYSNASGTVQFIELGTSAPGQQFVSGHAFTASQGVASQTLTLLTDLPGDTTNRKFLVATQGFADLGIVTPDYIMPSGFLFQPNGRIDWAGVDAVTYATLPTDGVSSIDRNGNVMVNSPTNFAGATGSIPSQPPPPPPPPPVTSGPTGIPTVDGLALIALALVLATLAARVIRVRRTPPRRR